MALPVFWDPEAVARRDPRVAAKGCHSLTFTENPATLGLPSFHSGHWDPMWKALVEEVDDPQHPPRLVGPARRHRARRADRRDDHAPAHEHLQAAADLVWSRVLQGVLRSARRALRRRHRLDPVLPRPPRPHLRHASPVDRPGLRRPQHPSECSAPHPHVLHRRPDRCQAPRRIGIDNMCWEQDYPHSDSSWPNAPEELAPGGRSTRRPDADLNKIAHENAMRWYRLIRSRHRAKAIARWRAPRRGAGSRRSLRAMDKGRFEGTATMTLGELANNATASMRH